MLEKIEADLKTALLAGDKPKVETLKGIKNALQYEAVNLRIKPEDLTTDQIQKVLARESKKRQEASDLYKQGGNQQRAESELSEKKIIDEYLPKQLDETEISSVVKEEVAKAENPSLADMGKIIGSVRGRLGAGADGATIARLVKQALENK
jgi:uncharacterized protein YqeY